MTPQEITHYSELMARFEGFKQEKSSLGNTWRHSDLMGVYGGIGMSFKYHTDYNWLHRVWVKFRDLKSTNEENADDHFHWTHRVHTAMGYKPIEEAFLELGKAIEWYINLKK